MNGDDEEDIGSQDTMDINVIILMFPNPTFSGNMVTHKACSQWATGKVATEVYRVAHRWCCNSTRR